MVGYAVLIDLATIRIGAKMFRKLYDDLKSIGSIEYIKFYNYNTKRHREFRSLIKEYNIEVELREAGKKRVRVDIRQVIDAVRIAATCNNITNFFLVCSEVDAKYLFGELKKLGKYIEIGVTSPNTLSELAHKVYIFDRMVEVEDEEPHEEKITEDTRHKGQVPNKDLEDEVALHMDTESKRNNIFPYSSVDSEEIDEKMQEIDRRILSIIDSNRMDNLTKIFGGGDNKN